MLAPPPDETPAECTARLAREAAARALSETIDAELKKERQRLKKRRERVVKLLLLGQSESGEHCLVDCHSWDGLVDYGS